jgi:hypothetical protein
LTKQKLRNTCKQGTIHSKQVTLVPLFQPLRTHQSLHLCTVADCLKQVIIAADTLTEAPAPVQVGNPLFVDVGGACFYLRTQTQEEIITEKDIIQVAKDARQAHPHKQTQNLPPHSS